MPAPSDSALQTFRPPPGRPRDFLITGIPRSGTSLLSKLLHRIENCVVINEPVQIFAALQPLEPWGVPVYYGELRRDIRDGRPVENKTLDGEVVDDTALHDVRGPYRPRVASSDFVLGTKNTLAYLTRLASLQRVMPEAAVVACVRHPFDAIASWKRTFPHLRDARVESFPVGFPDCPTNAGWQARRLAEIAETEWLPLRRALLWRYLAECLLRFGPIDATVRYEELTADTDPRLREIWRLVGRGVPYVLQSELPQLRMRKRCAELDSDDRQAIIDVCGELARRFGYAV